MTGRLSKCGKKPSRAPGPPSLSPRRSPLHPLQPAPGGCCPHPRLSWGPRVPEGPGHAHVAALAPKEPGLPSPQPLPPAASLTQFPERPQAQPKIRAGQGGTSRLRAGRAASAPRPARLPAAGLGLLIPGPQAGVRPSAPWKGRGGAPAAPSSEQRGGPARSCPGGARLRRRG